MTPYVIHQMPFWIQYPLKTIAFFHNNTSPTSILLNKIPTYIFHSHSKLDFALPFLTFQAGLFQHYFISLSINQTASNCVAYCKRFNNPFSPHFEAIFTPRNLSMVPAFRFDPYAPGVTIANIKDYLYSINPSIIIPHQIKCYQICQITLLYLYANSMAQSRTPPPTVCKNDQAHSVVKQLPVCHNHLHLTCHQPPRSRKQRPQTSPASTCSHKLMHSRCVIELSDTTTDEDTPSPPKKPKRASLSYQLPPNHPSEENSPSTSHVPANFCLPSHARSYLFSDVYDSDNHHHEMRTEKEQSSCNPPPDRNHGPKNPPPVLPLSKISKRSPLGNSVKFKDIPSPPTSNPNPENSTHQRTNHFSIAEDEPLPTPKTV
ncbi:hypothetical protein O181_021961 [Austropuccinia psidii MF-1]|uniref:Uncharacterized protein n=1 Tax=Austropuccinia psidii MF-1 TaxID=1389203 RepID=A0A9Q3GW90_9BASI|nr:hypothetical protein [Austropuccinia psidii MF-1]